MKKTVGIKKEKNQLRRKKFFAKAVALSMAVVMVAGNQPRIPSSLLEGARTMTANIVLEMGYAADLHREALLATGAVLFVFILLINLSFSLIRRKKK